MRAAITASASHTALPLSLVLSGAATGIGPLLLLLGTLLVLLLGVLLLGSLLLCELWLGSLSCALLLLLLLLLLWCKVRRC